MLTLRQKVPDVYQGRIQIKHFKDTLYMYQNLLVAQFSINLRFPFEKDTSDGDREDGPIVSLHNVAKEEESKERRMI